MKLTRTQMLVFLGIVTVIIAIVTNIATNQIPDRWRPYLWLSWPLLLLLIILFIALTHKTSKEPGPPPPPELNLKAYYEALTKRYRTLDLDALTPPQREEYLQLQLRAVFVEQSVRENSPPIELPKEILEKLQSEGELEGHDLPEGLSVEDLRASGDRYYSNPSTPVIDVLTDPQNQRSIILGDPGSGKSTLARYIMLSLIDSDGDQRLRQAFPNFTPIFIELRVFNALREERKCDTFLQFLEYLGKTEAWNLTEAALDQKLRTAGTVVIFDGLDEIFDLGDRERISHSIVGFSGTYSKARVIVTSRIIGYQRRVLTDAGFSHYTLQDLDRYQVESFITRWYELALADRRDDAKNRKERILKSFDQSASVRQLTGNPMLLTIMAIIGKHQELPRERWKLYDHAASVLIEHWDVRRHLDSLNVDAPFMGEEDKKELLRRLAYRMQAGRSGLEGNYIHRDQLQKEFDRYLKTRFTLPSDRATTISRIMIDQFRQRNFILSLYGATVYGFVHRAFLEYFCATAFTYKFEKARDITIEELAVNVFEAHWRDESWHEVLRLICGILHERSAGQLIIHLLRLRKSPEMNVVAIGTNVELALRCMGEVRNLNLIVDATDLAMDATFETLAQFMTTHGSLEEMYWLSTDLISAIEVIGTNWPNRERLARLLKEFPSCERSWIYTRQFGSAVASLGADLDEVRDELIEYAGREDKNYRALWPYALAMGWRSYPQTVKLLKEQLMNDPIDPCRRYATRAFLNYYEEDPEAQALMRDRLQNDRDGMVRFEAIRYLSSRKFSAPNALFRDRLSDDDALVRHYALQTLRPVMTDEATFLLVLAQAEKEPVSWVRMQFYTELHLQRRHDLRLRELLIDRASTDESPDARALILQLLADGAAEDPKVKDVLQTSRQNDPDQSVRDRAAKLLNESSNGVE